MKDQGIIEGVHSIIHHFEGAGVSSSTLIISHLHSTPIAAPLPMAAASASSNLIWSYAAIFVLACIGSFLIFRHYRQNQAKKNETRLIECRKLYDEMINRESVALDALKRLKSNYVQSVWKEVEEAFSAVDPDELELGLLEVERVSKQGWSSAGKAQSLIKEWERSMRSALSAIDAVPGKLSEVKSAQQKCVAILAGLGAAFGQVERETARSNISMATRKDLEKAWQIYKESLHLARQPANTVDWIVLLNQLTELEATVEKISKDAARANGIAYRIVLLILRIIEWIAK
jgi:hypothetical protein